MPEVSGGKLARGSHLSDGCYAVCAKVHSLWHFSHTLVKEKEPVYRREPKYSWVSKAQARGPGEVLTSSTNLRFCQDPAGVLNNLLGQSCWLLPKKKKKLITEYIG